MTPVTNDSLARAIDSLDAVEVAPGRYAFPSKVEPRWFTCDVANIALCEPAAAVYFAPIDAGRYFFGCKLTPCVLMPSWWSPEQRLAWQHTGNAAIRPCEHGGFGITVERPSGCHGRRITADLETGQEVSA